MIKSKAAVIYKGQCAVVTGTDGDKYTIEYYTGTGKKKTAAQQRVREKDVAVLDEGPAALDALLAFADNALPAQIAEARELVLSDEETAAGMDFAELAAIIRPAYNAAEAWGVYCALTAGNDFVLDAAAIKDGKVRFKARTDEEMADMISRAQQKEKEEQERGAFIARLKKRALLPEDIRFMGDVEAVALGQTDKSRAMNDAGMIAAPESAHRLLLGTGIWNITRNPYPTRYGLFTSSAEDCLPPPPDEERMTVESTAYAIDNAWSDDPDDAVAWDGEYLWVHVADPAAAVMPDSPIDKAARRRGTTLYLPEGVSRMLAEKSLEDYALGLKDVSVALSFRIKLDDAGAIDECEVYKTLVRVKRLTYQEATEQKDTAELRPLFDIARRNKQRREEHGARNVNLSEVHITVDEARKVAITPVEHFEAADMVSEMMLLAGEAVAHYAFAHEIPFPFVSQEPPDIPPGIPSGWAGEFRILRCMHRRNVGITPAPHAAIGVAMYTQVTSPLRRYGDLIAHEQLRAYLDGRPLIDKDEMLLRISAGDAASVAGRKASRMSEMHWKLVYFLQNTDWTGTAVCVDTINNMVKIYIPSLDMQSMIIPGRRIALNEELTVRAANIDIPTQKVDFVVLGK